MNKVVVISPAAIVAGDAQNITADLTKFDFAKSQVTLVVEKLLPLYKISSDEQADGALTILRDANDVNKAIEEKRKALVKPFNDGAGSINDYKKDLVKDLDAGIAKVKQAILDWQKEKTKKAKEELVTARQCQLAQLGFIYNSQFVSYSREGVGTIPMSQVENSTPSDWSVLITTFTNAIQRIAQQQVQELQEEKDILDVFGSDDQKQETDQKIAQAKSETSVSVKPFVPAFGPSKVKGTTKRWTFEVTDTSIVPKEYLIVDEVAIRKAIAAGVREIPGINIFQSESLSIR